MTLYHLYAYEWTKNKSWRIVDIFSHKLLRNLKSEKNKDEKKNNRMFDIWNLHVYRLSTRKKIKYIFLTLAKKQNWFQLKNTFFHTNTFYISSSYVSTWTRHAKLRLWRRYFFLSLFFDSFFSLFPCSFFLASSFSFLRLWSADLF